MSVASVVGTLEFWGDDRENTKRALLRIEEVLTDPR